MARTNSGKGSRFSGTATTEQVNDTIRKKAYELYEKRGRKQGNALKDWLEAERLVKQKTL